MIADHAIYRPILEACLRFIHRNSTIHSIHPVVIQSSHTFITKDFLLPIEFYVLLLKFVGNCPLYGLIPDGDNS